MNQVPRQKAKAEVERDFYKLLNNSSFRYDCGNNADNFFLNLIYNEIKELSYTKKYENFFDQSISDFVSSEFLERQIEEEYLNKFASLDSQDEYFGARENSPLIQKNKELNAVFTMKKFRQKNPKNSIRDINQKMIEEESCSKTKFMIQFDPYVACSIKCLAVKKIKQ